MTSETPAQAAGRLAGEHEARVRFAPLADEQIGDLIHAYAVQDALVDLWRGSKAERLAGWKIGLTTGRMQTLCGIASPIAGAILAPKVRASPASLQCADYVRLGLEMELAVRLDRPLDPGVAPDAASVAACVDSVCAAIEIVEDRDADYARLDAASLVADNSWNAGIVLGQAVAWRGDAPLIGRMGRLLLDGAEIDRGRTEDVGGDPLAMVAWLETLLRERGRRLEPGQWVMTGSIVPTKFAAPGQQYHFAIDGLPAVEVTTQ